MTNSPKRQVIERVETPANAFVASREAAIQHYGQPLGEGRHRVVFRDGAYVLKFPRNEAGVWANEFEASTCNCPQAPKASCHIDKELTAIFGRPVLRMEFVLHRGFSEEPDWTWSIDCGQVGYTAAGALVAYDWDHY